MAKTFNIFSTFSYLMLVSLCVQADSSADYQLVSRLYSTSSCDIIIPKLQKETEFLQTQLKQKGYNLIIAPEISSNENAFRFEGLSFSASSALHNAKQFAGKLYLRNKTRVTFSLREFELAIGVIGEPAANLAVSKQFVIGSKIQSPTPGLPECVIR